MFRLRAFALTALAGLCLIAGRLPAQGLSPNPPKDSASAIREIENYVLTMDDVRKWANAQNNLKAAVRQHPELANDAQIVIDRLDSTQARIDRNPVLLRAVTDAGLTTHQLTTLEALMFINGMMQMDSDPEHARAELRKAHFNPANYDFVKQHAAEISALNSPANAPSLALNATPRGAAAPAVSQGPVSPLSPDAMAAYEELGPENASRFEQVTGWFRGRPVLYYNFGDVGRPVVPGRVLWPVHGFDASGNPVAIRGQRPIFSTIPGVGRYSGVWRLVYVVTADHVQPNQLRDEAGVDALVRRRRATLRDANMLVNLPIVPRGSMLANDPTVPMHGWYAGRDVEFFDFGQVTQSPVDMWRFSKGADASGAPVVLTEQNSIVDSIPVSGAYPDLWQIHFVQVDSAYVGNSLKSAADLQAAHYLIDAVSSVRNLPITVYDGMHVPRTPSPLSQFADLRSPFPPAPTRP